jgi:hypothetical protein
MTDFRYVLEGTYGGTKKWTFGGHLTGGVSEATLATTVQNAAIALFNTATDGIKNYVCSDVALTNIRVVTLGPTMKGITQTTLAAAVTGVAGGQSLPWLTSTLVRELAPTIIKSGRGYMYLPASAESTVSAHVFTGAYIASLKVVLDVFFPAIHSGGVSSFSYNKVPRKDLTPAFTKVLMTSYEISNKPSHQERRVADITPAYTTGGAY